MSGIGADNSRKKRRNKKRGAVNTVYSTIAPACIVSAICDMSGKRTVRLSAAALGFLLAAVTCELCFRFFECTALSSLASDAGVITAASDRVLTPDTMRMHCYIIPSPQTVPELKALICA